MDSLSRPTTCGRDPASRDNHHSGLPSRPTSCFEAQIAADVHEAYVKDSVASETVDFKTNDDEASSEVTY